MLRSPGDAQLLLGISHYKLKRKDAALGSLEQAKRYASTKECAEEWIKTVKKGRKDATKECSASALAIKKPAPPPPKAPPPQAAAKAP